MVVFSLSFILREGAECGGFSLSSSASWGGVSSSPNGRTDSKAWLLAPPPSGGRLGGWEGGEGGEGEQQTGADPTLPLAEQLAPLWGQLPRRVVRPLSLKVGRIPS